VRGDKGPVLLEVLQDGFDSFILRSGLASDDWLAAYVWHKRILIDLN